jgi:WD40 repeat protein
VWDARTGLETFSLASTRQSAQHPVTKTVAETVRLPNGKETVVYKQVTALVVRGVSSLAFSPDNLRLASAGASGAACYGGYGGHGGYGHGYGGYGGGGVQVWDAQGCQEKINVRGHNGPVRAVAYSRDGKLLASTGTELCDQCRSGVVKVRDTVTGREVLTLAGHSGSVYCLAFSPDGSRLASGGGCLDEQGKPLPGEVKVWDTKTGKEVQTLEGHAAFVTALAWNADGTLLATGSSDRTARIWDVASGEERKTFRGHPGEVNALAYSPDGKHLAVAAGSRIDRDRPGEVKVWDVEKETEALTLKGHSSAVLCVAYSPDGKRLATGSGVWDKAASEYSRGELKLWDAEKGDEVFALVGHTGEVNGVAFSGDGKLLYSGSGDWTVRAWNAETGQEVLTFRGHTEAVNCVAASPDGRHLASGSADQTVKVWDVQAAREALGPCTLHELGGPGGPEAPVAAPAPQS